MRKLFIAFFLLAALRQGTFCEGIVMNGWAPISGVAGIAAEGKGFGFTATNQSPFLSTRNDLFINASAYRYVRIRMSSDKSYPIGKIFFKRIGDPDFSYYLSMDMQCGRNNVMNEYVLDMGRNPNWYGTVTQFLFCPGNVQGKYHVDSFEVLEPSSSLALESMWKSFMAFEVPQMWSVNFMFGPRIGGTSVNLYIYILILLVSVIWGAGMLAKTGDPKAALKMMPKIIVITSISLWVLLDLRILLDQGRNMLMDSQTFSCKSLEEKRALVTLGDYYDFISFAATKIPQGSSFNVIRPQGYYYMEKAVYYLYPDYVNEKPEYMMVFDPYKSMGKDIGEAMKNGYKAFATYKEGAFILKK